MTYPSTPEAREAVWAVEATRRTAATPILARYERGLITFDELVASLAGIRIDERGWAHPGATFPERTIPILARVISVEMYEDTGTDREWFEPIGDTHVGRCTNPACRATGYVANFVRDGECHICGGGQRPWQDPARRAEIEAAVEDEHSHGGTPTMDDGCGR